MVHGQTQEHTRRRIGVPVVLSAGIKVASAGLTFLMFVFVARALGPDAYGRFATMFSLGSFLGFLVLLGQHTRAIKRLSAWIDAQDWGRVQTLIVQSVSVVALASLGVGGGLLIAASLLDDAGRADIAATLWGTLPFILPFALSELLAAVFRAQGSIAMALMPRDILWRAIIIASAGVFGPAYLDGASAQSTMIAISAVLLVLVVLQALVLAWRLPRAAWAGRPEPLERGIWEDSKWLWAASLVNVMAGHLSVVFTSMTLSDAETGAFFAAAKIALLLQLPLVAVMLVAGPMLARSYAKSDFAEMQRVCRAIAPVLLGTSLAGAMIICAAPGWLLALFDPSYAEARATLIILTLAQLVTALCGLGTLVMIMCDNERAQTLLVGASELLGLVLIFALAPLFGLAGAAIAALVGKSIGKIMACVFCYRSHSIDPSVLCLLRAPSDKPGQTSG